MRTLIAYKRLALVFLWLVLCWQIATLGTERYYRAKESKVDPAAIEASVERIFDRFGIGDDGPGLNRFMAWQAERGMLVQIPARTYRIRSTVVVPDLAFIRDATFIGSAAADPVVSMEGRGIFKRNTVIGGGSGFGITITPTNP